LIYPVFEVFSWISLITGFFKLKLVTPNRQELIGQLQDAYRREFTRVLFKTVAFMKHDDQPTANLSLWQLAIEELEQEKYGIAGLEPVIQLFGRQAKKE
jgi:hypothetical protein